MVEFCRLEIRVRLRLGETCQSPRDTVAGQREQQLLDLIIVGKYFCALGVASRPLTSRVALTLHRLMEVSL